MKRSGKACSWCRRPKPRHFMCDGQARIVTLAAGGELLTVRTTPCTCAATGHLGRAA